jgi:tetratricopeptide (TPR) repeat protein
MSKHWTAAVRAGAGVVMTAVLLSGCDRGEPPPLLWSSGASPGRDAFFEALRHGRYDDLDPIVDDLTGEAAEGDDVSLAVLGFAHAWRMAEAVRNEPDPAVVGHIDLAASAFERAIEALPDDPRLVGFFGGMELAQGTVWDDSALQRRGWFDQAEARRRWPEWGLFTQAFGLVTFDPDEPRYDKGIELLWDNLDACVDERVDRDDFDWSAYERGVDRDEDAWNRRACANTDVAPHNVEGFFLIFGDAYAKAGDLDDADLMYRTALAGQDAGAWPYRWVAEDRRARLDELPGLLGAEAPDGPIAPTEALIFGGPISCTVCHQGVADEEVPGTAPPPVD